MNNIRTKTMLFISLVLTITHPTQPISIDRRSTGDIFDIQNVGPSCKEMKASCVDKTCEKCKCRSQETYYDKYCYPDLLHSTISKFYKVAMNTFSNFK